jgi:hypothetical protein
VDSNNDEECNLHKYNETTNGDDASVFPGIMNSDLKGVDTVYGPKALARNQR